MGCVMSSNKIMDDAEADDTECDKVDHHVITDAPPQQQQHKRKHLHLHLNNHRRHPTPASRYEFTG